MLEQGNNGGSGRQLIAAVLVREAGQEVIISIGYWWGKLVPKLGRSYGPRTGGLMMGDHYEALIDGQCRAAPPGPVRKDAQRGAP